MAGTSLVLGPAEGRTRVPAMTSERLYEVASCDSCTPASTIRMIRTVVYRQLFFLSCSPISKTPHEIVTCATSSSIRMRRKKQN